MNKLITPTILPIRNLFRSDHTTSIFTTGIITNRFITKSKDHDLKNNVNPISLPYKEIVPLSLKNYKIGNHSKHPNVTQKTKNEGKLAPPILMIHGLFGSKQNWISTGKEINDLTGRHVLGVDVRNHGETENADIHDYMHLTKDLIEFIEQKRKYDNHELSHDQLQSSHDTHNDKPTWENGAVLVGHSMGAKIAMLVSLLRPDLVSKLIVIDNSPISEPLDTNFELDLIGMCKVEMLQNNPETYQHKPAKTQLKEIDSLLKEYEPSKLVRMFLMSNLVKSSEKQIAGNLVFRIPVLNFLKQEVLSNIGDWPNTEVDGKTFSKPVLVMRGLKSGFVTDKHVEQDFPRYFQDIKVVDFDTGHWLVSDQSDKFVKEVVTFL